MQLIRRFDGLRAMEFSRFHRYLATHPLSTLPPHGLSHGPVMAPVEPTPKVTATRSNTQLFPFLKLPGELRNQIYIEVLRLYEPHKQRFPMAKTAKYHPLTKRSTAWALTQVSRQLRSELLPLVLPERVPQVALCELAEFLQDFYHGPTAEKSLPSVEDQNHPDGNVKQLHRHGYIKVWASRAGVHKRILSNGVALLPILRALAKCESLKVSFHKWCIWNWELAIIQSLHETWTHWCNDIPKLGFLDMHLRTEYGNNTGYPRNRLSSSITLNCKATAHTSEKKRVVDLARWVYKSGVRTLHQRVKGLTILFVTPKTNRGQASEVKLSVFASSMKLEWWSRGSYCVARLVDNDTTETGFSVVKKDVIGKDVLRL